MELANASFRAEEIARVCHETNRAYCAVLGDSSQLPWEDAPEWQKTSAVKGVEFRLQNPTAPPSASHDSWLKEKRETGWSFGPVKDPEKKQHPCFVPYKDLPTEQRRKDLLFISVVDSMTAPLNLAERLAAELYEKYNQSVGGKAWNGDALPSWDAFRADPAKQKQSEAWVQVAEMVLSSVYAD